MVILNWKIARLIFVSLELTKEVSSHEVRPELDYGDFHWRYRRAVVYRSTDDVFAVLCHWRGDFDPAVPPCCSVIGK